MRAPGMRAEVVRPNPLIQITESCYGKETVLLAVIGVIVILASPPGSKGNPGQGGETTYKDNSCVRCHARILEPLRVSSRYFGWHLSRHQETGVSCDRCHSADPVAEEQQKAHAGVLRPSVRESRLHWKNQPETCNACHQSVVSSFVTSMHYQRLKGVGLGPSSIPATRIWRRSPSIHPGRLQTSALSVVTP